MGTNREGSQIVTLQHRAKAGLNRPPLEPYLLLFRAENKLQWAIIQRGKRIYVHAPVADIWGALAELQERADYRKRTSPEWKPQCFRERSARLMTIYFISTLGYCPYQTADRSLSSPLVPIVIPSPAPVVVTP